MVELFERFVGKEVEVTQDDIVGSKRRCAFRCAISQAMMRLFGCDEIITYPAMIGVKDVTLETIKPRYALLGKKVEQWIRFYDAGVHTVNPFKMRLERLDDGVDATGQIRCEYIFRMV